MSRLIHQPVQVKTDEHQRPLAFQWRSRRYPVDHWLDAWIETGLWWKGTAGEIKVYRVATRSGIYELEFHTVNSQWYLHKIYD